MEVILERKKERQLAKYPNTAHSTRYWRDVSSKSGGKKQSQKKNIEKIKNTCVD